MRTYSICLAALLTLVGCASPAPEFFGAQRTDVEIDGIRFAVFQTGDRAEAVRLNYLTRSERKAVPGLMLQAVKQATGCRVLSETVRTGLTGDTGEFRMDLDCDG